MVRKAKPFPTTLQTGIEQNDTVRTGAGRVQITFLDKTTVKVTEQSKLVIDTFVYDPNPSKSKMGLKFASGTIRFATGKGIPKNNIKLSTPTATISVRGTDFVSTVDETGKSLIILLPGEDGHVGEILVGNAGGVVLLNKAFQATVVSTFDTAPSKPTILNLTLDMIDNMLIISPPDEIKETIEEQDTRANILDLNELDVDYLKNTELEDDKLVQSELDVTAVDAEFLEDMFNDMSTASEEKDGVKIEGTKIGSDNQTQINTILNSDKVQFIRSVNNYQEILVPTEQGKVININDAGKVNNVIVNDGGSSITITQKN